MSDTNPVSPASTGRVKVKSRVSHGIAEEITSPTASQQTTHNPFLMTNPFATPQSLENPAKNPFAYPTAATNNPFATSTSNPFASNPSNDNPFSPKKEKEVEPKQETTVNNSKTINATQHKLSSLSLSSSKSTSSSSSSSSLKSTTPATTSKPAPVLPTAEDVDIWLHEVSMKWKQFTPFKRAEQSMLDILRSACADCLSDLELFHETLQTIKTHFFNRDFISVFNQPEHLPVYTAMYVPMRALCYHHLWSTNPILSKLLTSKGLSVYCIGAGPGSELLGITMAKEMIMRKENLKRIKAKQDKILIESLANILKESKHTQLQNILAQAKNKTEEKKKDEHEDDDEEDDDDDDNDDDDEEEEEKEDEIDYFDVYGQKKRKAKKIVLPFTSPYNLPPPAAASAHLRIHSQDLFNFSSIHENLLASISKTCCVSYPFISYTSSVSDMLLNPENNNNSSINLKVFSRMHIITFMFVLNEMFTQNKLFALYTLEKVIEHMKPGAFILVVDSAGTFSHVTLKKNTAASQDEGEEEQGETDDVSDAGRTYMLYDLLDPIPSLKKVYGENSVWYRYPVDPPLQYPLKFENMRYFIRIYQKKKDEEQ